ncbi:hypothetical protein [Thiohalocapsa sp. ML1]|uniref:hypothetical protein n=1 Tax=Thiohalocapsa sp. ML1 TaxID=1431688 RepID=UPI000731EFB5|nr:hypothetical protein [Thiohalocapsa sp. ML1]
MFWTLFSFFFYLPLFLASFVLSIVAIAQRRLGQGIPMLLLSIAVPLFLGVGLGVYRTEMGLEQLSSPPASAGSGPVRDKKSAPVVAPAYFDVSLRAKEFREANYTAGVQEAVMFRVAFLNKTDKDIRAFDGVLGFTDLLDNEVLSAKLSINDPVAAHGELVWDGELNYNQFIDSHQRLRNAAFENLKVWFKPRKILYSNGSTEEIR